MTNDQPWRAARATILSAGALIAGLLVAGCTPPAPTPNNPTLPRPTQSTSPVSTSDSHPTAGTTPTSVPSTRCHTSMLDAGFTEDRGGSGMGHAAFTLWMRNKSGQTCTLYGFAGIQLVAANGQPLPTDLQRTPNGGFVPPAAPTLLTLPPGASATAQISYSNVEGAGEPDNGPCEPTPDHALITPPDERDPLIIPWRNGDTGQPMGPACQHGAMSINAFHK